MGWTSTHYDRHAQNGLAEFLFGERTPGTDLYVRKHYGTINEIATCALISLTEFYAVRRWRNPGENWSRSGENGGWFCQVTQVKWVKGRHNLFWKDTTENMGVHEQRAPRSVLEALERLDPLPDLTLEDQAGLSRLAPLANYSTHPYHNKARLTAQRKMDETDPRANAREWRTACWANVHQAELAASLKNGEIIRFEAPYTLSMFGKTSEFQVVTKPGGKGKELQTLDGYRCRIPGWQHQPFARVDR